ncbi:MAG: SPOR domain-containing protein [Acidimicrobiales bacterium]
MSRGRFALMLIAVAAAVFAASFAAGLQLLDDGQADPPPPLDSAEATDTTTVSAAVPTTTAPTTTAPAGRLASPSWVTIVASESSRSLAEQAASPVADAGYPSGVLHTDDYPSLKPGLWAAYAGPYNDARTANAAIDKLAGDGFPGAYVRCVGTKQACSGTSGD